MGGAVELGLHSSFVYEMLMMHYDVGLCCDG